jgi:septal ring factor EnvC (AmiA/AmiB activator)
MSEAVTAEEFHTERDKLEKDRAMLNERLQALNVDREATVRQLAMVAGALQTIEGFLDRINPEIDLPPDESHGPGPDEEK